MRKNRTEAALKGIKKKRRPTGEHGKIEAEKLGSGEAEKKKDGPQKTRKDTEIVEVSREHV